MQLASEPIAVPVPVPVTLALAPARLRVTSFSRRRHIDLQRVTSSLCRS
jgi:hypothetical protein